MKYLIFSSQQEAVTANLKIFENLARSKSKVCRTSTDAMVDPRDIKDGDLVAKVYVIPGYKKNSAQLDSGETTAYAVIHKCDNGSGYVIPKPEDKLMAGVLYDSIEEYDAEWYADEII